MPLAPHLSVGPLCPPQSLSEVLWGQQSRMTCPILQWGNSSFCSGFSVWICALFLCFIICPEEWPRMTVNCQFSLDFVLTVNHLIFTFCLAWKCSVWPSSIAGVIAIRLSPQFFSGLTSQIHRPVHLDFLGQTLKIRFWEPWKKDNRNISDLLLLSIFSVPVFPRNISPVWQWLSFVHPWSTCIFLPNSWNSFD